jgi:hypothetical protein
MERLLTFGIIEAASDADGVVGDLAEAGIELPCEPRPAMPAPAAWGAR